MAHFSKNTLKQPPLEKQKCFHCGDVCADETVTHEDKYFCCHGCKSVFELLQSCSLTGYYSYNENPGIKQLKAPDREAYSYLDDAEIADRVLSYKSEHLARVSFRIPAMHCASCIWLLENMRKLVPGILESRVNFMRRDVRFTYDPSVLTLRKLVEQLATIGYPPELNLDSVSVKNDRAVRKRLIYQIAVAGFCFGNIMLLSFPDYIAGSAGVDETYRRFFGYINFVLALPVLLYSSQDYLTSAWQAVRTRHINMDIPISLGILALFFRSSFEIFMEGGGGYMDSLAALLFFLLIGKWIQQKTYDNLSFERDYKSYFPIAVQRVTDRGEEPVGVDKLAVGDHYRLRSGELIPADSILISGEASIDYSFVSGESDLKRANKGEKLFAGGRQHGAAIMLEVARPVDQSYLTSLWNSDHYDKKEHRLELLADRMGRNFTIAVVLVAITTGLFWLVRDPSVAVNAVSAVLIVACPCALALSFPFAFGNAVRLLGRQGFYLKNTQSLAKMAEVTTVIFDKTGTLTRKGDAHIGFTQLNGSPANMAVIAAMTAQSAHPLSRYISEFLSKSPSREIDLINYSEVTGAGIQAEANGEYYRIGSATFTNSVPAGDSASMASYVYVNIDGTTRGYFTIDKNYHPGLKQLISEFKAGYTLHLLSGDDDSEQKRMEEIFGSADLLHFNCSPFEKKQFIANLKARGEITAMVGDGLNDAGALRESDFGVAVADDVFRFTPASDAILSSARFSRFDRIFAFSRSTLKVVRASFALSILYNTVGVLFAVQGLLTPVVAAILMPLSSVSVVLFVTLSTNRYYRKHFPQEPEPD